MIDFLLLVLATIVLIIGSIHDIRVREVPDWLNFFLIFAALGIRLLYSVYTSSWSVLLEGIAGFAAFFILALVMFYTGQWGGGDSKLLMGLGAVFGLDIFFFQTMEVPLMVWFFVNSLLVGAIYGLVFSIVIAIKRWKIFWPEYIRLYRLEKTKRLLSYVGIFILGILLIVYPDPLVRLMITVLMVTLFMVVLLWIFIKTVESVCMVKNLDIDDLTEGDWIVDPIYVEKKLIRKKGLIRESDLARLKHKDIIPVRIRRGVLTRTLDSAYLRPGDMLLDDLYIGRYICGPKDLGIERHQMKLLKEYNIKSVRVKEGIPFVPSFFVAFVITISFEGMLPLVSWG